MRNRFRSTYTWLSPLRAALALAFLIITSLQPITFAVASANVLHGMAELAGNIDPVQRAAHAKFLQHHHSGADGLEDKSSPNHQSARFAEMECEVNCAPATTVPIECLAMREPVGRCFGPGLTSVLSDGEPALFIRPPRRLN